MKVLLAGLGALAVMGLVHGPAAAQEPSDARVQFQNNCAACHGPAGEGLRGPSLVDVAERLGRDGVEQTIRDGRVEAGMPSWAEVLSDEEIVDMVDFLGTLPEGATPDEDEALPILLSGLEMPTAMAFTEAGGLYIAEKKGVVKFSPMLGAPAAMVASIVNRTYDYGGLGLNGLAVHQDHVYVAFSTGMTAEECGPFEDNYDRTCVSYGEIGRFPIEEGGSLGEMQNVAGGVDDPIFCMQFSAHGMGGLFVRSNGELLVGAGDGAGFFEGDIGQIDGDPCGGNGALRAQNPGKTSAMGAISIINDDGSLATLANGMRNPFAMTEMDGVLYSANTGWDSYEEIDRVEPGHNSGWPCFEGLEVVDSYPRDVCEDVEWDEPLFMYPNADPSGAISALAAHDGRLYFGDYVQQWVKSIDPEKGLGQVPELVARGLMPVSLQTHGDSLFVLDIFAGNVVVVDGALPAPAPVEDEQQSAGVNWRLPAAAGALVVMLAAWVVAVPARQARRVKAGSTVVE